MDDYWNDFTECSLGSEYDIDGYLEGLISRIDDEFSELDENFNPAHLGRENAESLYNLVREREPEVVVETGVCNGLSSAVILKALEDNSKGGLFSVDLPEVIEPGETEKKSAVIPPGRESGWVVPLELRENWALMEGDTFYETPRVLKELGSIDMFLHDSDHSYEGMMFEYSLAWRHLREEGVILSDNIEWNDAFVDFARAKELKKYRLGSMGVLFKG